MEETKTEGAKSYHVLLKARNDPSTIEAPAWFATKGEAEAFGLESIRVLGWYVWLEAWKIAPSDKTPTHMFFNKELISLKGRIQ
jgi:hypothetical protein